MFDNRRRNAYCEDMPNTNKLHSSNFDTVTMNDLAVGDIVLQHGCLFRVTERIDYTGTHGQACIATRTELVEVLDPSGMPAGWRHDWNCQGASWVRVSRLK